MKDPIVADVASVSISVLIPAFNEELLIARAIDGVRTGFASLGFESYEIVVCDNNSTDRTAELAQARGARVVVESHNQIARARNTAAKAATGKWLIFLDADSFVDSELLKETIACFKSGMVCCGGSILRFDRTDLGFVERALVWTWNRISVAMRLAAGSYLFCYRQAWADVGGFDEEVYAGEEIFFSLRLREWAKARQMKFKVLTKSPVVTSARKMDWYGRWELLTRMLLMARPGALKDRKKCGIWYSRPEDDRGDS